MSNFRTLRCGIPFAFLLIGLAGCTAEMKARCYAGEDRDEWQQPDRVIASLALEPGHQVADLGAGGGYFSFRLAQAVGPSGKLYALDIDEEMNERLEALATERGAANLEVVLAEPDDLRVPEPVDLIFTSNTYHHLDDRSAYFENAARYLRPGGRVAIIEYKEEGFFHRVMGHATGAQAIREEMESAGYHLDTEHAFLEKQHFLIFSRAQ